MTINKFPWFDREEDISKEEFLPYFHTWLDAIADDDPIRQEGLEFANQDHRDIMYYYIVRSLRDYMHERGKVFIRRYCKETKGYLYNIWVEGMVGIVDERQWLRYTSKRLGDLDSAQKARGAPKRYVSRLNQIRGIIPKRVN